MIGLIDSGVGGLNVLAECVNLFNDNFIYFCDNKNAPYGNKTKKKLFNITKNNIDYLIKKYNINILVLACNTISSMFYYELKAQYPQIVIIPTFPPFKLIEKQKKDILFFGTKNTLKHNKRINYLINNNEKYKGLYINNLPKIIDKNINKLNDLIPLLNKHFNNNKFINVKTIVLCCTHFKSIKSQIEQCFNYKVNIFEYENIIAEKVKMFSDTNSTNSLIKIETSNNFYPSYIKLKVYLDKLIKVDKILK